MNSDTAELAIVDSTSELIAPLPRPASDPGFLGSVARAWRRLRADPARMAAMRDTAGALLLSRALVWLAGVGTLLAFGFGPVRNAFNPPGVTRGFGWLGDLLAAPAARWDASWYLVIAHYGYRPELGSFTLGRAAFFPLYPAALRGISWLGVPAVLAGVFVSVLALALALYGIHRLTTLELAGAGWRSNARPASGSARPAVGEAAAWRRSARPAAAAGGEVARLAVLVTAFAPMAFYFSAVYAESLYLALSVGVFWCARQGRWAATAALGALAGATRSAGVVLLVPALILYLYGPREDGAPDALPLAPSPGARGGPSRAWARLGRCKPRYRVRADVLWLALVPAGLGLYMLYLAMSGGDALAPFHAQEVWSRQFAGPYVAVWDGIRAAWDGARQLLSFQQQHLYFPVAAGSPFVIAGHNLMLLGFLIAALVAVGGVLRRLPLAYGAYVIVALALPLSYPVAAQPLMSLPRFLVVLFPLNMWFAAWLAAKPSARAPAVAVSALLMAFFVAEFATWHWVA